MPYAPVLTKYEDAAPMPRVEVLFNSFAPTTASATIFRLAQGREYKMRGGVKASTSGALTRIDFEIPFGVTVTYRAEMFNAAGLSLGFTDQASVVVNSAMSWMHNPLDPKGGVAVEFARSAAASINRPIDAQILYPEGRTVGVLIGGARSGVKGVALNCYTQTLADADKFTAMLGGYTTTTVPILCVRLATGLQMRLPRPFFASVLNLHENAINVHAGKETILWDFDSDEVAPPAPGLFAPLLTRADLNKFYATRAALNSDNLTRLAVNRRYDLAGVAG